MREKNRIGDTVNTALGRNSHPQSPISLAGYGIAELLDAQNNLKQVVVFKNLVTQVGDQYYAERAAGIATPPDQVTGMQLGTDTTAPAKSGAGSAIGAYIAGSALALEAGYPTAATQGNGWRVTWRAFWDEGVATNAAIAEVALINQAVATDSGAPEAATIARALFDSAINKGATDTLRVTWNHDLLGA